MSELLRFADIVFGHTCMRTVYSMMAVDTKALQISIQRSNAVNTPTVEVMTKSALDVFTRTRYAVTKMPIRPVRTRSFKTGNL